MGYLQDVTGLSPNDKVLVSCDICGKQRSTLLISAKRVAKKNGGQNICRPCKAKITPRPQNSAEYWTEEKRRLHSASIKSSETYYKSIEDRDISGPKNGMFGRHASEETKRKMSSARVKRIGPLSPAWKGGKTSMTRRVKGLIHSRYHWYARVYQRDGWACASCGLKNKIDAHHIEPVFKIIKRLCMGRAFATDEEKLEWLVLQPELRDDDLTNGRTLCRDCHKKTHENWGSRFNP